jgi:4-hydroxy-2-oxoheptanedioate aldolase
MNKLEQKMVTILQDLKKNHHVIGVKAEFEAEGTRLEEAMRLKEVVSKAGLDLTIKIGGCEAIKDMYEAKVIGVSKIIAPMIESPFALQKFMKAAKMVFPNEEFKEVKFFINVETISAYKCLKEMLSCEAVKDLSGIVIGRGDMAESIGLTRNDINKDEIFKITYEVLKKSKENSLICGIGGGVSADSLPFLANLPKGLDFFETRKVIFKFPEATKNAKEGILKALGFELMWLKNKKSYYYSIYKEDADRINTLESRYQKSIIQAGGMIE